MSTEQRKASMSEREAARSAWIDFCDRLKTAGDIFLRDDLPLRPADLPDGLTYLSRLSYTAFDRLVECVDPAAPMVYPLCNERIKVGGDNPDNRYFAAPVSSKYEYVLTVDLSACTYYSFSIVAQSDFVGGIHDPEQIARRAAGSISSNELPLAADGTVTLRLGGNQRESDRLPIAEDADLLMIRCTIEDPEAPRTVPITLRRIDQVPDVAFPDLATVSARLRTAATFVNGTSNFFATWAANFQAGLNEVQLADQDYIRSVGGDPSIIYYMSAWALADNEALIVDIPEIPPCRTWNFQLADVWVQSLDYRRFRTHVNSTTAVHEPDGSVRIVIAARDPGAPNWLNTAGHRHGTLFMRLVEAEHAVSIRSQVAEL